MYIYVVYRIWHFDKGEVAQVREPVKFKAYTNYNECKNALLNYLADYTYSEKYFVQPIQDGNYNRKELLQMKDKEMISGFGIFDLESKHSNGNITRYLINRYRLD